MNFTVQKQNILSAMDIAIRAIPSKTNMTVLYNFLIEVDGEKALGTITSTDMSTSIKTVFSCMVMESGKMCVDAKTLMAAIKKMGNKSEITFECGNPIQTEKGTDYGSVIVTGAKARYEFPCGDIEEYPEMPTIGETTSIKVNAEAFREMIDGVAFSVSTNTGDKLFTAINMRVNSGKLRLVTSDKTRVSIRQKDISCKDKVDANVPCKTMVELAKSLDGGELTIEVSKLNIRFTFGNTTMVARLIDGNFFNVDQLFKNKPTINIECQNKDLADSIDRAMVISSQTKDPIVMDVTDDSIKISFKTNVSNFDEELSCEKHGEDIRIGMNPQYVLEALKATSEDGINIGMINNMSPLYIVDDVADEYAYVILPVNL